MAEKLKTIGLDADDTLWENEPFFRLTQERFAALLRDFAPPHHLMEHLEAAERRNIKHYGFGVKGFVLSMIETAVDVTDGKVPGSVIKQLIREGQEMLRHPIHLLPHAADCVEALAGQYHLLLITKGDLLDQERKLAQSGLGEMFDGVEIVSDKTPEVYDRIFARHETAPEAAMMVGNSLKSDIIPMLECGGWGVYVPQEVTWEFEHAERPETAPRFREIDDLSALPGLIDALGV